MNQAELITYFTVLGVFEPNSTNAWFKDCGVFVHEKYVRVISDNHTKSIILNYPVSIETLQEILL